MAVLKATQGTQVQLARAGCTIYDLPSLQREAQALLSLLSKGTP